MKKQIYSTMVLGMLLGSSIIFSGCVSGKTQTIEIEALSNGSKKYSMNKSKPNIKTKKYRGYNIEGYNLGVSSENNTIILYVNHTLRFTQGSGTPIHYHPLNPRSDVHNPENFSTKRWKQEKFWLGFKKVDIVGLKALSYGKAEYTKNALFDWYTESINTVYNKQEFIDFVKKHPQLQLNIKTQKRDISTDILGMENIQKFVACLEDEKMCKDKEESK